MRKLIIPDKKDERPRNFREAKELIRKVFRENKWDSDEQSRYFKMLGVEGAEKQADVRKIIEDFERSRLIIFEEKTDG